MKKIFCFVSALLISVPVFADDTNYTGTGQCFEATWQYSKQAAKKNLSQLSHWFYNFSMGWSVNVHCDNDNQCQATINIGCEALDSAKTAVLWPLLQAQLNQQIEQLHNNQESAYGDKPTLKCNASGYGLDKIDFASCK
jgi:hypothetical protein